MSAYLKSFASTTMLPFELAYPQTHRLYGEVVHQFIESLRQEDGLDSATKRVTTDPNFDNRASPATCAGLADLLQAQLPPISEMDNPERMGRPKDYKLQKTLHFTAPLALLDAAVKFNFKRPDTGIRNLYVAQAPLNDLPKELQDDLPVPKIVKKAGKGDIYDSSIWLGLEPTYTPLHRDPNPNLFIQLCGNKIVRLLPPASGERVYREVQSRLGTHLRVNSRLRGTEMMDGPERYLMHNAIWNQVADDQELPRREMQEGMLQPGDSLFIPKGWWHSVKSEDDAGRLNASVNWWFR
ncbi:hypothetical protein N0V93_002853 [Gnomoniopsis smithogilvyi]|uniref:JmjC domain-containing protein n=1 Tax=Gnomoniopsis smithogilvyi TaxID=1191159 RepID=A0A9W8YX85_9PEZI|nr:hypothetical protein N0V93_002853 [Gnomoniopsis smithogilvyi]